MSDIGPHRASNQDAAFTASWGAAVADGVGGGPSGDLASAALVHRLVAGGGAVPDAQELLVRIREANWDLGAHVRRDPALQGMATTFTGLFVGADDELLLAHSGDSRGYLLRDGWFSRETRDDSYVQVLVESGLIAPEAAASHPRRNLITASLGGGEDDTVSITAREALVGDRWMLCSDGVTDYVPEDDLARLLYRIPDPRDAAAAVVALALEAGTLDNVTAIVTDVVVDDAQRSAPVFSGSAASYFAEDVDTA